MAKTNDGALFRLSPDVAEILGKVAEAKHFSEAMLLEMLVRKEAIEMAIIRADHPETAFWHLINTIQTWTIPPTRISPAQFLRGLNQRLRQSGCGNKQPCRCLEGVPTNASSG